MITSKLEEIKYDNNLPFKCYAESIHCSRRHYHNEITILLLLKGSCRVLVNNVEYDIKENDVFLINSNEIHEVFTINDKPLGVVLQFDPKKTYIESNIHFDTLVNSNDTEHLDKIKGIVAKIYKNNIENRNYFSVQFLHELISFLFLYFRDNNINVKKQNKQEKRITSISNYIENNYKNRITLQDLADKEALSVSYLSNFFEKWFGKTFLQYYNDVRIDHAVDDLMYTDLSIEEISYNNGYDDPRSFVAAFKKRYQIIPSQYRKLNMNKMNKSSYTFLSKEAEAEIIELTKLLDKFNYTREEEKLNTEKLKASEVIHIDNLDYSKKGTPFENRFTKLIGVVSAHDLLLGDVQNMLIRAKKEIGYEALKFHGLLSDEMELYFEDENGNPQYNYFLIDKVLDFIVSIQMKPLIELTYMPKKLAKNADNYIFNGKYLISEPKDMKKWCKLIENLIDHIISKYGEREIEKWKFTIWNLPETGKELFGFNDEDVFFDFYKKTFNSIKDMLPNAIILSPTFGMTTDSYSTFLDNFIDYASKNECLPDVFNVTYSSDIFYNSDDKYSLSIRSLLNKDPNHFSKSIEHFKEALKNKGIENPKIELTSWMLTASHRNLINDTSFKSCYYVKNYLENYDKLDDFGYWCLTDLNGESPLGINMFYGGQGLFTRRAIEKSTYNAIILLAKLGNEIIYQGKGYFITKSHKKIHIVLYNYLHYSDLYAEGKLILNQTDRYTPFNMSKVQKYALDFENINADKVFIKEYSVGRQHGSSFDAYLRMGGIELKYDDEFEHLKRHSSYYIEIEERDIKKGRLHLEKKVNPLEVKLIEIKLQ